MSGHLYPHITPNGTFIVTKSLGWMQEQKTVLGGGSILTSVIFLKYLIESINETYLNHMKCITQYLYDKTNLL